MHGMQKTRATRRQSILHAPIRGADDAIEMVRRLVPDGDVEGMLVLGLDTQQRLCGVAVDRRHRALSFMKVWELEVLTAELDCHALVVAVFPRAARAVPSEHEISAFLGLRDRARRARVPLVDCLVVREHRWWSLRDLGEVSDRGEATSCAGCLEILPATTSRAASSGMIDPHRRAGRLLD
jgi:hypothetical protein